MSEGPAIVAVGYNRPDALARLLDALRRAAYRRAAPLVISLDCSGEAGPGAIAEAFDWPHGPKRIIRHPERLGLREHILRCGDLTRDYGGIVLFEDDIIPAPHFHDYVLRAMRFFEGDDRIGGIALYSYRLNEFDNRDFEPLDDGSDVFFLQVAASWGQAWSLRQWSGFREWYARHKDEPFSVEDGTPRQLEAWRANSWKRFYIRYLVKTGRYFVYPRASLSTNMAVPGTNTRRAVSIYQVPLDLAPREWHMLSLDRSRARYDVFAEPEAECLCALNPTLGEADFDVDLFGSKPGPALRRPRLLTSRAGKADRGFGLLDGAPPAAAIVQNLGGDFFRIGARERFGSLSLRRRLKLIRATQSGRSLDALGFQMLKPVQTELMIARQTRRGASRSA
ncbi:hypothetical protein B2G71_05215 [Novosphingobium sp. PC22D]|uniref:glycosyl transferase family 2 n=1 Tax=Novosphingobium sp. PC22D TaxID=1962403 RepID=UPI000BF12B12|nr:glycosyl transferase family 2 [Novosphingobium sp. PC22D]PEQ13721.1 hypothetical protein B2G71_05215 [Novosphingobium sp. PC22D]